MAIACEEIAADPLAALRYTTRGNLVGVITNGTAVLGLGAIGPLAAKPVMEGKAVLFKKFANIDVFDIEINETRSGQAGRDHCRAGTHLRRHQSRGHQGAGVFRDRAQLRARMKIPVFHDDQHGTAIIVAAAALNGLAVVGKKLDDVKLVVSGAGAAALACVDLLVDLGLPKENIWLTDLAGLVYEGRAELMDPDKARFAQATQQRTLGEAIAGADIFLGLSAGGVLKPDMVKAMAARPLIFALANPTPEILPAEVRAVRDDAVMATGRSDYPNQVNNVLCFPFIFRGALDAGATSITRAMEIAAVHAIADLARMGHSDVVASAYGIADLTFGPDYLIPKPFDPRLIVHVAPAVARAAMESGVATRPIADFDAYVQQLQQFVYQSGTIMKPVFASARRAGARALAHRVRRRRGRARAARRADHRRREDRASHPGRAAARARVAHQEVRCAVAPGRGLHRRQPRTGRAASRVLDGIPRPHEPPRRHRAIRQARNAPAHHAHRRHAAAQGRSPTA